ncbi:hypothetical protein NS506_02854 [Nocardia seriolae]|uniref:Uncharacterized protein n=1 Tax=Nocardia seriolae TaxID=37332 RepID=A0ABC8ARV4_9NOCA|nr:hypothetical protein NS506_02854 [Nocardia seriolae]BEK86274.1 hypothetical protein NSERKGN1266_22250 [Nocardia seriolae]BEK97721.1 hypothetical protein NSER024013_56270 [Nocardia seriolae]GEM22809.1 hypothetical protein NS2_10480 [Nocardia seriolae NBRC 15557]
MVGRHRPVSPATRAGVWDITPAAGQAEKPTPAIPPPNRSTMQPTAENQRRQARGARIARPASRPPHRRSAEISRCEAIA